MSLSYDIAADLDTPVSAFLKLRLFRPRFLLESVEQGHRIARYSYSGFGDCTEVRLDRAGLLVGGRRRPRPARRCSAPCARRSDLLRGHAAATGCPRSRAGSLDTPRMTSPVRSTRRRALRPAGRHHPMPATWLRARSSSSIT